MTSLNNALRLFVCAGAFLAASAQAQQSIQLAPGGSLVIGPGGAPQPPGATSTSPGLIPPGGTVTEQGIPPAGIIVQPSGPASALSQSVPPEVVDRPAVIDTLGTRTQSLGIAPAPPAQSGSQTSQQTGSSTFQPPADFCVSLPDQERMKNPLCTQGAAGSPQPIRVEDQHKPLESAAPPVEGRSEEPPRSRRR